MVSYITTSVRRATYNEDAYTNTLTSHAQLTRSPPQTASFLPQRTATATHHPTTHQRGLIQCHIKRNPTTPVAAYVLHDAACSLHHERMVTPTVPSTNARSYSNYHRSHHKRTVSKKLPLSQHTLRLQQDRRGGAHVPPGAGGPHARARRRPPGYNHQREQSGHQPRRPRQERRSGAHVPPGAGGPHAHAQR